MRLFLAALALFCVTTMAQAQTSTTSATAKASSSDSSLRLTPVLGLSQFNIEGESVNPALKDDSGVSAGLLIDAGQQAVFQTGLLYYQTGTKVSNGQASAHVALNYLAIPLFAKFNFSGDVHNTFFLKAGFLASYLAEAKAKENGLGGRRTRDVRDELQKYDAVASVGLGGQISAGASGQSLMIEGTYHRGLITLDKDTDVKIYNQGFMVNLGYSFDI